MRNWIFAIIVLAMLSGAVRADPPKLEAGSGQTWEQFKEIPARVLGRVLGTFIREGMTEEQVTRVLGKDQGFPKAAFLEGLLVVTRDYPQLGLSVSFKSGRGGIVRVDTLHYYALFGRR
jgi:hypothetical protein